MTWLKHQWNKFESLSTGKKAMVVGGIVAVFVFITYLFSRNNESGQMTTSEPVASPPTTTYPSNSGNNSIVSPVADSSNIADQLHSYKDQLNLANQMQNMSSYRPNNYGSISDFSGLGSLLGGSGTSSSDPFGLGYNSSGYYNGSLGYTNTLGSTLANKFQNSNPLGQVLGMFGVRLGDGLRIDRTDAVNVGLDRTGIFAENFGGLPAGVSEQQATRAYQNAMDFNRDYYGTTNTPSYSDVSNNSFSNNNNSSDTNTDSDDGSLGSYGGWAG